MVLTDGEVWNVDQIFDMIRRNNYDTQVFSVGIGEGASSSLVTGMAKAGRGRHEMVKNNENLQIKVVLT